LSDRKVIWLVKTCANDPKRGAISEKGRLYKTTLIVVVAAAAVEIFGCPLRTKSTASKH